MENILFLGGTGFIGSNIIRYLQDYDVNIYILDSRPLNPDIASSNTHMISGLLKDIDLIKELIDSKKISKIIHLISCLIPNSDFQQYLSEYNEIILPTLKLIRICSERNVQFIFFSSGGTIYGNHPSLTLLKENNASAPISYYGLTKQTIEEFILFENRTSGLKYLILRPSNPYGPGQNTNGKQGLIAVTIGNILSGKKIFVWGNGSSIRDYIYIDDLATIVCQLIINNIYNLTLNIGSGKGYTVNQVLSIMAKVLPVKIDIEHLHDRKTDVSNVVLDISLLNSLVRVKQTPLEEGIKRFYNYAAKNYTR